MMPGPQQGQACVYWDYEASVTGTDTGKVLRLIPGKSCFLRISSQLLLLPSHPFKKYMVYQRVFFITKASTTFIDQMSLHK